jgi:cell division protein FtsB
MEGSEMSNARFIGRQSPDPQVKALAQVVAKLADRVTALERMVHDLNSQQEAAKQAETK